jgi:hypothetical protein
MARRPRKGPARLRQSLPLKNLLPSEVGVGPGSGHLRLPYRLRATVWQRDRPLSPQARRGGPCGPGTARSERRATTGASGSRWPLPSSLTLPSTRMAGRDQPRAACPWTRAMFARITETADLWLLYGIPAVLLLAPAIALISSWGWLAVAAAILLQCLGCLRQGTPPRHARPAGGCGRRHSLSNPCRL